MDAYKVDYHIYTTYSIGGIRPLDVVKQAKELEYDVISITDRNTTDGLQEAKIAAEAVEIRIVPGVELLAETEDGIRLQILGYNIDTENEELQRFLKDRAGSGEPVRPEEAIGIIKKAGGTSVLGAPITISGIGETGSEEFFENLERTIKSLKIMKLAGLECFYPNQSERDTLRLAGLAEKYHLHMTRGSGFDGSDFSKAGDAATYI